MASAHMNAPNQYDVAVVGAGIVGMVSAAIFSRAGARVCIIDPSLDWHAPHGPVALRNYAIAPGAQRLLQELGAWSKLDLHRLGSFNALEVWDAQSAGEIGFAPPASYDGAMGWIVEHQNLLAGLSGPVADCTAIRGALGTLELSQPNRIALADGTQVQARLVIGADGANSPVRNAAGIDCRRHSYRQHAWVANVVTSEAHGNVARQRFLDSGPLAFLPLADPHHSSIVWSCTDPLHGQLDSLDDDAFAARLGEAFEQRLGVVTSVSARVAHPLERLHAQAWSKDCCALIGDAAHVVHPLAGLGLNLGIMDAVALSQCLTPIAPTAQWPRRSALRRYERWRKSEALRLGSVIDVLQHLFSERSPLPYAVRGLGMRLTAGSTRLTRRLSEYAMGTRGDLPSLPANADR